MLGILLALVLVQQYPAECADACPGRCCDMCQTWITHRDHRAAALRARAGEFKEKVDRCLTRKRDAEARAPDCSAACAGGTGPCCHECMEAASGCEHGDATRCDAAVTAYEACVPAANSEAAKWAIPAMEDEAGRGRVVYSVQRCYFSHERQVALAGIKDEKEAAKIAGLVDKAKLYRLQSDAHNSEKALAQLDMALRKLKARPFACDVVWLDHLVQCMHARDEGYADGECRDEPWKSVRDDLP